MVTTKEAQNIVKQSVNQATAAVRDTVVLPKIHTDLASCQAWGTEHARIICR